MPSSGATGDGTRVGPGDCAPSTDFPLPAGAGGGGGSTVAPVGGSGAGSRGRAGPRRGPLLVATASGTVLNPLNSSLIAVALIQLAEDFELLFACVSWMISLFHLTSAVAQPVSGRLGDVFGPRRLFLAGLALIGLASPLAVDQPGVGAVVQVAGRRPR